MTEPRPQRISTFGSRLTSIVSVTLVLLLAGVMAMIGIAGTSLSDELRRNLGFTVKFERDADAVVTDRLTNILAAHPGTSGVCFLSADSVMAQERRYLGDAIDSELDINPYSSEIEVKVSPQYANPDSIAALCLMCGSYAGVEEVITESAVVEGVHRTLERIGAVLAAVCFLLLLISIALINNTVSLSIYSRRFLIHTMKLVGATPAFIRRPFVTAGLVNGLIAGIGASALLLAMRYYASGMDVMIAEVLDWNVMALICTTVVIAGALLCSLTAFFAAGRYIKANYDEMFLQ